jgi:hypothetical protein
MSVCICRDSLCSPGFPLLNIKFQSPTNLFDHFSSSLLEALPLLNVDYLMITPEDCPRLRHSIPCQPNKTGRKVPDMLQLELPATFPIHARASEVSKLLKEKKVVLAPAVSGGGKVCLLPRLPLM